MQIINELFDAESVYPFEMTKETAAYKMYTFAGENTEKFSLTFHISPQLGNKAVTVKLGQATGAGGAYFKPLVKKFSSPMRVIATLMAVVREYAKEDVKGKTKLGFAFGLPMAHFGAYQKLVGKLINRELRGTLKTFESGFDYSDDKYAKGLQFTFATRVGKTPKMAFNGEIGDAIASGSPAVEDAPEADPVAAIATPEAKPEVAPVAPAQKEEPKSEVHAMFGGEAGGYALVKQSMLDNVYDTKFVEGAEKTGRVVIVGEYSDGVWLIRPFTPNVKPENAKADYSANPDAYTARSSKMILSGGIFEKILTKQAAFTLAVANIKASQAVPVMPVAAEPEVAEPVATEPTIAELAAVHAGDIFKVLGYSVAEFVMFDAENANLTTLEADALCVDKSMGMDIGAGWLCYSKVAKCYVMHPVDVGVDALASAEKFENYTNDYIPNKNQLVLYTNADVEVETLTKEAAQDALAKYLKKQMGLSVDEPAVVAEPEIEKPISEYTMDDAHAHAAKHAGDVYNDTGKRLMVGVNIKDNGLSDAQKSKYQVIKGTGLGLMIYNVKLGGYVIAPCGSMGTYDATESNLMGFVINQSDLASKFLTVTSVSEGANLIDEFLTRNEYETALAIRQGKPAATVEPVKPAEPEPTGYDADAIAHAPEVYDILGKRLFVYAKVKRSIIETAGYPKSQLDKSYHRIGDECLAVLCWNTHAKAYIALPSSDDMFAELAADISTFAAVPISPTFARIATPSDMVGVSAMSTSNALNWISDYASLANAEPNVEPTVEPTAGVTIPQDHPYYGLFGDKLPVCMSMAIGKLFSGGWFKTQVQKTKGYAMAIWVADKNAYAVIPFTSDKAAVAGYSAGATSPSSCLWCYDNADPDQVSIMSGRIKKIVPYSEALKKSGMADVEAANAQGGDYYKSLFGGSVAMLEVDKAKVKGEAYHFKKSNGVCFAVWNTTAQTYVVIPVMAGSASDSIGEFNANALKELVNANIDALPYTSMVKFFGAFVCDDGVAAAKIKKVLTYEEALAKSGVGDVFTKRLAQINALVGVASIAPAPVADIAPVDTKPLVTYGYWTKKFGNMNILNYAYVIGNAKNPVIGGNFSGEYEVFAVYKLNDGSFQMIPWGLTSKLSGEYRKAYDNRTPLGEYPVLQTVVDESLVWKVVSYEDALARAKRTPDEAFKQFWENKVGGTVIPSVTTASSATQPKQVEVAVTELETLVAPYAKYSPSDVVVGAYAVIRSKSLYGTYHSIYAEGMRSAMIFRLDQVSDSGIYVSSLRREMENLNTISEFVNGTPTNTIAAIIPKDKAIEIVQKAMAKAKGVSNSMMASSLSKPVAAFLKANKPAPTWVGTDFTENWKDMHSKLSGSATVNLDGFSVDLMKASDFEIAGYLSAVKRMIAEGDVESANALMNTVTQKGLKMYDLLSNDAATKVIGNHENLNDLATYTGSGYGSINEALRGGTASPSDGTLKRIVGIDKLFTECGLRLPSDAVVYRGQPISTVDVDALKNGGKYILHGFTSTSTKLYTAIGFSGKSETQHFQKGGIKDWGDSKHESKAVIFAIRGLDKALSVIPGKFGNHYSECEIVLNRGTVLKLDKFAGDAIITTKDTVMLRVVVAGSTSDDEYNTILESQMNFEAMGQSKQADNDTKIDVSVIEVISDLPVQSYAEHKAEQDAYYAEHPEQLARWTSPM